MDIGFQEFQKGLAFGIMSEWPILRSDGGDFGMSMHSRGFVRSPRCAACSVMRKRASSPSNGAQKNDLQLLWSSALGLVRPTHTARSRSVVWRRAHLSGHRGASGAVQELRAREARAARRFFENWRASSKWQRLKPYEKFAEMIDRHWDGIAAYCRPENKVSLGFVEGLNNKIRVIQRRAYGLHDEEYLRLKVLTCMLPQL